MSSEIFSLQQTYTSLPDTTNMRIGLVVSEWNGQITEKLMKGAINTLKESGVGPNNITVCRVPGSFELIYGCAQLAKYGYVDAIIAIGCVIRGDTPHFDYICAGTTQGLAQLNVEGNKPVIYGLITANTMERLRTAPAENWGTKEANLPSPQ